jgi:hypothetical protein
MKGGELHLSDFDGPERRSRIRFPIGLGARYKVYGRNGISGTGQTENISGNGVLITSAHQISPDTAIRVVIEWPVLLGDVCPMALHIHGKVVRSEVGLIAVRYVKHELLIQPKPPQSVQGLTQSPKPVALR